jgi:5-methylcytosine-specific restriction protein A
MRFEIYHNRFFNAVTGAFSRVTQREYDDSQITLTDVEAEIVLEYFGRGKIHRGNVGSNKLLSKKVFKLYGTSQFINLNLIYLKRKRDELRLYLSKAEGFKPTGDSIWFIFVDRLGMLNIGCLPAQIWSSLGQVDLLDDEYTAEVSSTDDFDINTLPNEGIIELRNTTIGKSYARTPGVARKRIVLSNYRCEYNEDHLTFISTRWNKPYVEAHHIIPMSFQDIFESPLEYVLDL